MPSRRRVPKPDGCQCKGHVEDDFRRLSPRQRFTRGGSGYRSIPSKIPLQVRSRMRYVIALLALLLASPTGAVDWKMFGVAEGGQVSYKENIQNEPTSFGNLQI